MGFTAQAVSAVIKVRLSIIVFSEEHWQTGMSLGKDTMLLWSLRTLWHETRLKKLEIFVLEKKKLMATTGTSTSWRTGRWHKDVVSSNASLARMWDLWNIVTQITFVFPCYKYSHGFWLFLPGNPVFSGRPSSHLISYISLCPSFSRAQHKKFKSTCLGTLTLAILWLRMERNEQVQGTLVKVR